MDSLFKIFQLSRLYSYSTVYRSTGKMRQTELITWQFFVFSSKRHWKFRYLTHLYTFKIIQIQYTLYAFTLINFKNIEKNAILIWISFFNYFRRLMWMFNKLILHKLLNLLKIILYACIKKWSDTSCLFIPCFLRFGTSMKNPRRRRLHKQWHPKFASPTQ